MIQLIYVSTARDDWNGRFDLLCSQASRNNVRDEITGILLQRGDTFLQVLEGPRATVEDTFIRIVTDSRHGALELLSRRVLTGREFGEWSMNGLTGEAECDEAIAHVARIIGGGRRASETLNRRLLV